jgi:hypothetical protein
MNVKHLGIFLCSLLIPAFSIQAEDNPNCFIINSLGKVINLNRLCNPPKAEPTEQEIRQFYIEMSSLDGKGMDKEALKKLNDFISKYPNLPIPYIGRANTRFRLNDIKGAIEDSQIAKFLFIKRGQSEFVGGTEALIKSFSEELSLNKEFDNL